MGSVDHQVALVTGAPSGIGIDLSRHLHSKGYRVALIGRKVEPGTQLADELDPDHNTAEFYQTELSSYASQASTYKAIWEKWHRIDVVAANAGIVDINSVYILPWRSQPVESVPPEPDLSCTDIDYKGVIYGTQLATHYMRHNPIAGGKIIVTGSIGGVFPHRTYPEYCGAKAAVIQFVRGIAPILKDKDHITINIINPGIVNTPIVPPEMIKAVSPECLTSISTVLRGYDTFLDDATNTKTGQVVEASVEELLSYNLPEMANGYKTKRAITVWEPLFRAMHGEESGLVDAIQ